MNTIEIIMFDNPMMIIGLTFLTVAIVFRIVRYVLDILP
jgi:hypothetical protein